MQNGKLLRKLNSVCKKEGSILFGPPSVFYSPNTIFVLLYTTLISSKQKIAGVPERRKSFMFIRLGEQKGYNRSIDSKSVMKRCFKKFRMFACKMQRAVSK